MSIEQRNQNGNPYTRFRIGLHIGMGIVYLIFGFLVLYVKYFGTIQLPAGVAYALGTLLLIYGAFRITRGVLDMRNRARD